MGKLPIGEDTIPLLVIDGQMLFLKDIENKYPTIYNSLFAIGEPTTIDTKIEITDDLLITRFKRRMEQGRETTIHRFLISLSPSKQLAEMRKKSKLGKELLNAEKGLLEWELGVLKK